MYIEIKAGFNENEIDSATELMKFLKTKGTTARVTKETKEVSVKSELRAPVASEATSSAKEAVRTVTETAAAPAPQAEPTPEPEKAPEPEKTYTLKEVMDAGKGILRKPNGHDILSALLKEFNAKTVTALKPDQYGAFITAATAKEEA